MIGTILKRCIQKFNSHGKEATRSETKKEQEIREKDPEENIEEPLSDIQMPAIERLMKLLENTLPTEVYSSLEEQINEIVLEHSQELDSHFETGYQQGVQDGYNQCLEDNLT